MQRSSIRKNGSGGSASRYRFYGNQFVLDTVSGNFYRVTPAAGFILQALIDGKKPAALVNVVQERFKIDRARALRDIEMFAAELRSLGIIEQLGT